MTLTQVWGRMEIEQYALDLPQTLECWMDTERVQPESAARIINLWCPDYFLFYTNSLSHVTGTLSP